MAIKKEPENSECSLSLYFYFRNNLKTRAYCLPIHFHPYIISCHPLCLERVHEAGYKLGH